MTVFAPLHWQLVGVEEESDCPFDVELDTPGNMYVPVVELRNKSHVNDGWQWTVTVYKNVWCGSWGQTDANVFDL